MSVPKFTEEDFQKFIAMLQNAPLSVKENAMCYYYYNSGACTECPLKFECGASEARNDHADQRKKK